MKLDQICRTCLTEKTNLKPLFNACLPNMLMSFVCVQISEGDGLPHQICTQCITSVSKAYSFKQICEKSDAALRNYLSMTLQPIQEPLSMPTDNTNFINEMRSDFFGTNETFQQSSFFQDFFYDPTKGFVDDFTSQQATTDLAETMQSLQTIAEQCLPESWEADNQLYNGNVADGVNNFTFDQICEYKCQFCGESFQDEWTLGEHSKMHGDQNSKYFCMDLAEELNKSIMIDHSLDNTIVEELLQTNNNLLCNVCDRTFTDQKYLKKHLKDIHFINTSPTIEEKKFVCNICGKRYRQNKVLMVHMKNHSGKRPLRCELCGRTFALPSSLHKHRQIHQERKYECTVCGKKFTQSSNLNAHLITHTGEKSHICNVCGKRFATNTNLEIHKRIHSGCKPFVCTYCEKAFISSTQLKKHLLVHTGEKPYLCWQCGRSFRRKETRDTHVRYHTGERPYACDICDKKYVAASHLRDHKKTHSNTRNYDCMVCLKKFYDLKTLKSHILTHTGQKPYNCQYCNKNFTQSSRLHSHVKSCHTNRG